MWGSNIAFLGLRRPDYHTFMCLSYTSLCVIKRTIIKISDVCGTQYENNMYVYMIQPCPYRN